MREVLRISWWPAEGDGLVVVQVDHAVHVGAQPQDLAVHLVSDGGGPLAVEDAAVWDVGDDEVLDLHLFQAYALRLGVADAVLVVRVRRAYGHAAERALHVAARGEHVSVADVFLGDRSIELNARVWRVLVDLIWGGRVVHAKNLSTALVRVSRARR